MAKFNKFERVLASQLHKFPLIKYIAKLFYQHFIYFFYRKKYKWKSQGEINAVSSSSNETFWGYYDKSPISSDNKYVAYNISLNSTKKTPDASSRIKLEVVELASSKIIFSTEVWAFNWQQGCRAQWLTDSQLIYNDYDVNRKCYVSKLVDISKPDISTTFELPVYDCFKNEFAYSVSFERLHYLRPDYGYRNHNESSYKLSSDCDDGLYHLDFKTGKHKLLLSFNDFLKRLPVDRCSDELIHKFNHLMLSPDGTSLMFLHRYYAGGVRFDRLIVMDTQTCQLKLLVDEGMVSHCCWNGNSKIIGYFRFDNLNAYYQIDLSTDKVNYECLHELDGYGDGHPSISSNGHLITDTYPDKSRMKNLILLDLNSRDIRVIGEVFEGLEWRGESRCDLHPRFSVDGEKIYFDSVHEGKRQLYYMENPLSE